MLVSAVLTLLVVPLEPLLTVMGQIGFLMANRTWITLAYFPVLYGLTRHFSLTGACYATALSSFVMFVTRLWRAVASSLRPPADSLKPASSAIKHTDETAPESATGHAGGETQSRVVIGA
nr:hypothetical protein [Asaia bogorensis]